MAHLELGKFVSMLRKEFCNTIHQTADIAELRAILSEAIHKLSLTEGSEPFGTRRGERTEVGFFF